MLLSAAAAAAVTSRSPLTISTLLSTLPFHAGTTTTRQPAFAQDDRSEDVEDVGVVHRDTPLPVDINCSWSRNNALMVFK